MHPLTAIPISLATARTDADAAEIQHAIATGSDSTNDATQLTAGIVGFVQKATSESAADVAVARTPQIRLWTAHL
jgi:hypothetical protein